MADKNKLAAGLGQAPSKPIIRRGQGVRLSTDQAEETTQEQERTTAQTHHRTIAPEKIQRVNRGYKLREDIIKACKTLANDTDRNLYEVMETALIDYLRTSAPDLLTRYGIDEA
jgi:hypothetical protein